MIGFFIFVCVATLTAAVACVVLYRLACALLGIAFRVLLVLIEVPISLGFAVAYALPRYERPRGRVVSADEFAKILRYR